MSISGRCGSNPRCRLSRRNSWASPVQFLTVGLVLPWVRFIVCLFLIYGFDVFVWRSNGYWGRASNRSWMNQNENWQGRPKKYVKKALEGQLDYCDVYWEMVNCKKMGRHLLKIRRDNCIDEKPTFGKYESKS
ncbi:hypothetical protein METBIDRAFT_139323 [Metschnikowia bicuspidata var. bicuspidata NRRL YB-4993]|uniref:Uncharacterized protein n=1 Tax=Metschnikowia bicuspidata var. bicuspidata NRRL YB-4993 TaxID=869754 RepID=A0A1A0HD70_9ASCO|nr:hypothetical protein METBIDRAFT_139323 [Metschnikowia bicuspidata var. bicuspidata NRRL YB-4993]OBA21878.1 hypothetical protein METBIDRAFT_139323 [Metschnikowia bicuspidata var. bicuspidata NRRL YB-4993]